MTSAKVVVVVVVAGAVVIVVVVVVVTVILGLSAVLYVVQWLVSSVRYLQISLLWVQIHGLTTCDRYITSILASATSETIQSYLTRYEVEQE